VTTHAAHRPNLLERCAVAARDIKLAHSVFALPFALLAAFLAGPGSPGAFAWPRFTGQLGLILLCMVSARTWAMLANRVADARLDAANPRTAGRAFAAGRLSRRDGAVMLGASSAAFIGSCALFGVFYGNWWPLIASVPVLAWIAFYSLTKRFTALCHVFLGGALGASPLAAAVAVDPGTLAGSPAIWLLSGMVVLWVAGFDVIYALQDLDHDRDAGLHSIPARLGVRGAVWTSRVLHGASFACLLGVLRVHPGLGVLFGLGVVATGALLIAEHVVLARRGKAGLQMAFFTLNGVISLVLGGTGIADILI
jgi:4-hydroxybenzoate polyprenyltransferase